MGLDIDKYKNVRSNILSMEPLPNLNKAYAYIIRVEKQQQFTQSMETRAPMEASTFKVNASKPKPNGVRPKCSHCQKLGHEKHQCFELIGYPPNWQARRANRNTTTWNLSPNRNSNPNFGEGNGSGFREFSNPKSSFGSTSTQRVAGGKKPNGNFNGGAANSGQNFNGGDGPSNLGQASNVEVMRTSDHGKQLDNGFAGFTPDQVEQLFNLFKERQSQEMMSGPHFEEADWNG